MQKFLAIAAVSYLLLVGFVYLTQASLLYLPNVPGRALDAAPEHIGLEYEEVWLDTSDGVRVHGWFVPGETSRTVLYFHGNAGNISHRLHTIRQFNDLGVSVFIIDYRGYGESEGSPSEDGLHRDAEAAWQYLTDDRGTAPKDIIVFGRSLGASVAAWLAAEHRPGALVVDSSFTSVPDVGADVYPWLPVRWLSKFQHATKEHVTKTDAPLLVIHSRDDDIIPFKHGEAVFSAANEPKTFLELRGGHNDAHFTSERTYLDGLREFLQSVNAAGQAALDDAAVSELLQRESAGVFYAWSPHMPLSVDGLKEITAAGEQIGVDVIPVLSPHANIDYARDRLQDRDLPESLLQENASAELVKRELFLHAPAILVFSDGEFVSPVLPGLRRADDYADLIRRFLDSANQ